MMLPYLLTMRAIATSLAMTPEHQTPPPNLHVAYDTRKLQREGLDAVLITDFFC